MKVSTRKFKERGMTFFSLRLDDGRETYCRAFSGEFDKRTQADARNILSLVFKLRPQSISFD